MEEQPLKCHKSSKRKHRRDADDDRKVPDDSGRDPSSEAGDAAQLWSLFSDLCGFLRSSLALYMQHTYASHVIRAVLQVLAGQRTDDLIVHSRQRGIRQHQPSTSDTGLCFSSVCVAMR